LGTTAERQAKTQGTSWEKRTGVPGEGAILIEPPKQRQQQKKKKRKEVQCKATQLKGGTG